MRSQREAMRTRQTIPLVMSAEAAFLALAAIALRLVALPLGGVLYAGRS